MKALSDEQGAWSLRPLVLLPAAYLIVSIVHESAHALTAYALNIRFTLFHFAVNLVPDSGTLMEYAAVGVAGPLCALIVGLVCWFAYRKAMRSRSQLEKPSSGLQQSRSALLLLYLVTFGVGTFFGNLMSAPFARADFNRAAVALSLPVPARYAASLIGLISICGLHFLVGSELRRLSAAGSSRLRALLVMVVLPVVAGIAIVGLSFLPTPSTLAFGRLAEASFWIFTAAGLLMSRNTPSGDDQTLGVGWVDVTFLVVAIIAVRVMAMGISF